MTAKIKLTIKEETSRDDECIEYRVVEERFCRKYAEATAYVDSLELGEVVGDDPCEWQEQYSMPDCPDWVLVYFDGQSDPEFPRDEIRRVEIAEMDLVVVGEDEHYDEDPILDLDGERHLLRKALITKQVGEPMDTDWAAGVLDENSAVN